MSTPIESQTLWQPQSTKPAPIGQHPDRLWCSPSHKCSTSTSQTQLWRKPKPALPTKPDSLRAPGLWHSTSCSPDAPKKVPEAHRRVSRSPSPSNQKRHCHNWIDPVLPKYVGRSTHYRNSHSIWAEQMFRQHRQQSIVPNGWIDNVLPLYIKAGPYRTSHSIWAEKMFHERRQAAVQSWIDGVLPSYVKRGSYRTSHSIWKEQARLNGANVSWIDDILPSYVKRGPYRTSYSTWMEHAPLKGANVCWIDSVLPRYVTRAQSYQTSLKIWSEQFAKSTVLPPVSSSVSQRDALTPLSASSSNFQLSRQSSFQQHRASSSASEHTRPKSIPKTTACYPPGALSRTGSSLTANEEPAPLASLLSPPSKQNALGGLKTLASTRFAALQSPCLFHNRFEDAVNLDRVLEEIEEEDGLTSGRLVQTATSVREISKQLQRKPIKRAVRSIMIVTKARDNSLVYLTRELALWLLSTPRYGSDVGVTVYVDAKLRTSKRFDAAGIVAQEPRFADMLRYWDPDLCWSHPQSFDLVLTLGGDGTVLFTSFSLFQRIVPPVLAFGLGSLGFLTPFTFADYKRNLNKVMGDEGMRVNLRMRFTCTVFRAPTSEQRAVQSRKTAPLPSPVDTSAMVEGEQFEVLNELVIDRGPSPYVSNLELYADDALLTVVQADGCIFSTPTGSTAYSLSAGGPLTHPSIPGLVLTPICPHTLSFRPMVLGDALCLKVCIPRDSRSTAFASFDGKHRVELRRGDCVRVEAGRYPFPTVVGDEGMGGEWFGSVRRALRWNTRGAMQKAFGARDAKSKASGPRFDDSAIDEVDELAMARLRTEAAAENNDDDGDDDDDDNEEGKHQEEAQQETDWDIDFEPAKEESAGNSGSASVVDSGIGMSENGSNYCASPTKKVSAGINSGTFNAYALAGSF